jgi:hypothetical protein
MSSKKSSPVSVVPELLMPDSSGKKPTFTEAVRTRYRLSKLANVVLKLSYREMRAGNKRRVEQLLKVRYVLHKRLKSMESTIRSLWRTPSRRAQS